MSDSTGEKNEILVLELEFELNGRHLEIWDTLSCLEEPTTVLATLLEQTVTNFLDSYEDEI
jgi:hypothetical protein